MKNITKIRDVINKIYIIIILMTIFLNWNINFLPDLGRESEMFFVSSSIYSIFKIIHPFFEKFIKIIYYSYTIGYVIFNIYILLISKEKKLIKSKLKKTSYLLFVIVLIFQIKFLNFSRILFFFNISALLFFTEYLYAKKSRVYKNNKLFLLIFINLALQFFSLKYYERKTLGWIDPNFSSYFLFLFYVLIDNNFKNKRVLKFLIIIGSFFISSRSFYLSFIIYIILKNKKISKMLEKLLLSLKMNSSIILLVVTTLITFVFAEFYINNIKPSYVYKTNMTRLVSLNDNSNFYRFYNLIKFKENLIKNKQLRNIGLFSTEYLKIENNFPHNGSMEIIRKYGFYLGILALITIFSSIFEKLNYKSIGFFISMLTYQTFLGVPFQGVPLLLLAYINYFIIKEPVKNIECTKKNFNISRS